MHPQQPYQPYPQQGSGQYPYPQQAPTYGHPGDGYPGMYPSPQIVVRGTATGSAPQHWYSVSPLPCSR
jgi:hypothetical protein